MYIAELVQYQLLAVTGITKIAADLRAAGDILPAIVYEIESDAKSSSASAFVPGARVFHIKFGNGTVASVDGNKLTVEFDKAGEKRVIDQFVSRA